MKTVTPSIRDILYEAPGKKQKIRIVVGTVLSLIALFMLLAAIVRRFDENGQLDVKYWSFFARAATWRFIGNGLLGTLKASLAGGVIAFFFGLLMMMGKYCDSRIIKGISMTVIGFSRGVPTLLLIYFFFLVVPQLGIKMNAFFKIVLPVAISASGTVAETLYSGVLSVPKGQREAAYSLGLRKWRTFFLILFPQGFAYVIPALIAELVIVLKDTTFAYVVNYPDLMQNAKVLISNHDAMLSVYLVVSLIYILINYLLNKVSEFIAGHGKRKQQKEGKKNVG